MASHLAKAGWGLDILALDPAQLHTLNQESLASLPAGTRLFGIPDTPPLLDQAVQLLVTLRHRFLPRGRPGTPEAAASGAAVLATEARQGGFSRRTMLNAFHAWREYARGFRWARRAAALGMQVFEPGTHRWVACSSPPHMAHEAGRLISRRAGIPFLADFRDPWRFSEWVSLGPAWLWLARRHEPRMVRASQLTVVNVEPVRELMHRAYPESRIVTITNGVDDQPMDPSPERDRFVIGYPGGIYLGRDPAPLVAAFGEMVRTLGLRPADAGLEFMGFFDQVTRDRLLAIGREHGVEAFLVVHSGASRAEALRFMASCAVLVALQQGSDLAIPAKIFEYMRFPAWVLVLASREGATARLLEGSSAIVHEPEDLAGLTESLTKAYRGFREGGGPPPLARESRFGRGEQTARLIVAINAEEATKPDQ